MFINEYKLLIYHILEHLKLNKYAKGYLHCKNYFLLKGGHWYTINQLFCLNKKF